MCISPRPRCAIAVLVGGEILEDRFHRFAVRVGGILLGHMRVAGHTERVIGVDVPVEHEPVVVGVGDVALELAEWRATRPGLRAISVPSNLPFGCSGNDIQKPFESEPAATLSRNVLSGLVIQNVDTVLSEGSRTSLEAWPFALTAWRSSVFALSGCGEAGRDARLGRMTLGLDRQVADKLGCRLDAVFEEEAVPDGVVGHVVLNLQVVRAMHGHAAVVGVVDRGVPDVRPLASPIRCQWIGYRASVRFWPMR